MAKFRLAHRRRQQTQTQTQTHVATHVDALGSDSAEQPRQNIAR